MKKTTTHQTIDEYELSAVEFRKAISQYMLHHHQIDVKSFDQIFVGGMTISEVSCRVIKTMFHDNKPSFTSETSTETP